MTPILMQAEKLEMLETAITDTTGRFDGAEVGLFTADLGVTDDITLAAVEASECDYPGYARQAVATWGTPYIHADGSARVASNSMQFMASADNDKPAVRGEFMVNAAGTALISVTKYDEPVSLADNLSAHITVPEVAI